LQEAGGDYGEADVQVRDGIVVVFVEGVAKHRVEEEEGEDVNAKELCPGEEKLELDGIVCHRFNL
jgi:hypothetical protein